MGDRRRLPPVAEPVAAPSPPAPVREPPAPALTLPAPTERQQEARRRLIAETVTAGRESGVPPAPEVEAGGEQQLVEEAAAEAAGAAVTPAGGSVMATAEQGPEGPAEEAASAAEEEPPATAEEPAAAAPAPAEATAPEGGGDGTEAVAGVELVLEPLPPLVLPAAPFLDMPREQARFTAPPLLVLERRTPARDG